MPDTPPIAGHVGVAQTVEALGRTWTFGRWTRAVWRDFLDWARPLLPDPRAVAAEFLKLVPDSPENTAVREAIVVKALHDAQEHLTPASPRVTALLGTPDGMVKLVQLLLHAAHGPVAEEVVHDLILFLGPAVKDLLERCAGVAPPPKGGPGSSPAPPPASPAPAAATGLGWTEAFSERPG